MKKDLLSLFKILVFNFPLLLIQSLFRVAGFIYGIVAAGFLAGILDSNDCIDWLNKD